MITVHSCSWDSPNCIEYHLSCQVYLVRQFKPWLSATGATLRSLTLKCNVRLQVVIIVRSYTLFQASSNLTDEILEAIAPSLVNLEHLNLSGCYSVTHLGVWAIVSSSMNGILGLALINWNGCHGYTFVS